MLSDARPLAAICAPDAQHAAPVYAAADAHSRALHPDVDAVVRRLG